MEGRKAGDHQSSDDGNDIEEARRLRAPIIYEIVRREGDEELARPLTSLWWSGIAAGLGISMSVVAEGMLHRLLPDRPWRPLVENFGYCAGFLIVIIGRLQLFTENTITAVLPLAAHRTRANLIATARLWGIVFAANLVGTFAFAAAATYVGIFSPEQVAAFREVSHHVGMLTATEAMLRAVPAGFLVAAIVWMLPSAEGNKFWVILAVTYLIALGEFAHVVAGSAEIFLLLLAGEIGLFGALFGFIVPAFLGNVIGGTALFAVLAYAQVKEEI